MSTTIATVLPLASFSPLQAENAPAVYVPSATKDPVPSMPSQVTVPFAPPARVPMESSRTSVPPSAVPARSRTVIPLTLAVGLFTVITVLSLVPALLAWLGEKTGFETLVTVWGAITVRMPLFELKVLALQPAVVLVIRTLY